jgi:hypothetical protein
MSAALPGRIPWTTLRTWAEYNEMTADRFARLDSYVHEMDTEFLAFQSERAAASAKV